MNEVILRHSHRQYVKQCGGSVIGFLNMPKQCTKGSNRLKLIPCIQIVWGLASFS